MNNPFEIVNWENKIFHASFYNFDKLALELFHFQYLDNTVYRQFTQSLNIIPEEVNSIYKIPFLPVQLFKTHAVKTTEFEAETVFESSGTTQSVNSKHHVKNLNLYQKTFLQAFELFYGLPDEWCILGLLPSYIERQNASLIFMAEGLINNSMNTHSGFYLDDYEKLHHTLLHNEILQQPTLLLGVTFALLEFAEKYKMKLRNTIIMETGGMKGRREEITREEVHEKLQKQFGVTVIHSEYGMTEILSQAYSRGNGFYKCVPWMKVLPRDEDDPLLIKPMPSKIKSSETGLINIIDLANIYSCAFIATDDIGKFHNNGTFEVLGRRDNSDMRGCSLLTVN